MKILLSIITTIILTLPLYAEMTPSDISYYTEEYPPYNYKENEKVTGFATDILLKMFEILNVKKTAKDISIVPWARGYNDVQRKRNVCLFTMTKTIERVNNFGFRWVGPIITTDTVLFALKSKKYKINSVEDMNKYRICAIREDVAEQTVVSMGYNFDHVDRNASPTVIVKKLLVDRCSLWAFGRIAGQWIIKINNYNTDDFEIVKSLSEKRFMYYAFNKNTPDSVILPLQTAFDELKAAGVVDQLVSKYLK